MSKKSITDTGDPACDPRGRRDRLMEATLTLASEVGIKHACEALDVARAGFYRMQTQRNAPFVEPNKRPSPPCALSSDERQGVLDILHTERFVDKAPYEVYATLLDEGQYHCSIR